jgi:hypothetical protein
MGRPSISKSSVATGNPTLSLSDQQRMFVDGIMRGTKQTHSARAAGYRDPATAANRLMRSARVVESIQYLQRGYEKSHQMTRKKVMDGMLEAIEMAKIQAEPATMVTGWREIGRMCGYYAAEKKVIDINITAKRAVDKLETLSDAELLEMIDEDSETIEGDFTEVFEGAQ